MGPFLVFTTYKHKKLYQKTHSCLILSKVNAVAESSFLCNPLQHFVSMVLLLLCSISSVLIDVILGFHHDLLKSFLDIFGFNFTTQSQGNSCYFCYINHWQSICNPNGNGSTKTAWHSLLDLSNPINVFS